MKVAHSLKAYSQATGPECGLAVCQWLRFGGRACGLLFSNRLERQRQQRGVFVILFAVSLSALIGAIALAVNVYFMGVSMLQQRNTVENVALAAVKILVDPEPGTACAQNATELELYNCVLEAAAKVGGAAVAPGSSARHIESGQLKLKDRASGNSCADDHTGGTPDNSQTGADDTDSDDDYCWSAYESENPKVDLVFGSYTPNPYGGGGTFEKASKGSARSTVNPPSVSAVRMRLRMQGQLMSVIAPFAAFFGDYGSAGMNSSALAYWSNGQVFLEVDPQLGSSDTGAS